MSTFFVDDTVAFKSDPSILCTVQITWTDVNQGSRGIPDCYVHKDSPSNAICNWFDRQKLSAGYVIVQFMQEYDGDCLISMIHSSWLIQHWPLVMQ